MDSFVFRRPEAQLPIGQRGLIGDGRTCALVRVDGVIDWLCLPRFDAPSVFAGVLDAERGGQTAIRPVAPFEAEQRYVPQTNVLETVFRVEGQGVVQLADFMPWTDDVRSGASAIHRRVRGVEGEVELELVFDPRFDYGRAHTTVEVAEHGLIARADDEWLRVSIGGAVSWEQPGRGRLRVRAGERRWVVLDGEAGAPEPVAFHRPDDRLDETLHGWRTWAQSVSYGGAHHDAVLRSALVMKLLCHAPTGGMVAAPTTSLPEWIGGTRNWDYRYTWIRDAAMSLRAANRVGCAREARDFFLFMRDAIAREPVLQVMYTLDGLPVPSERELEHLSGHRGSRPVRIGNGARHQLQHDITGALIDAASTHERRGDLLPPGTWRHLRDAIEQVEAFWSEPDHGIWEPRHGTRHNVHSKLMGWLALDRGAELARRYGDDARAERWAAEARRVQADVRTRGVSEDGAHYTAAYGEPHADASLLLMPLLGFVDPRDPVMRATVERTRAELGAGPYLYRYHVDDGIGEPEGAFVLCGFWLAEALALEGRLEEAREVFDAHADRASNHLGLLAEEVEPTTHAPLGNFPQAFSHLGLIDAALRLDEAGGQTSSRIGGVP